MLSFLLRKMINEKWMVICLLIGNILLIGSVASVPIFSEGTMQRLLNRQMRDYGVANNITPGQLAFRYNFQAQNVERALREFHELRGQTVPEITNSFGIPILYNIEHITIERVKLTLQDDRFYPLEQTLSVSSFSNIEQHIKITEGQLFSPEPTDGIIDCIVSRRTLDEQWLSVGDILEAQVHSFRGEKMRLRIAGVYENSEEQDFYWVAPQGQVANKLIIPDGIMREYVEGYATNTPIVAEWYSVFDNSKILAKNAKNYMQKNTAAVELFDAAKGDASLPNVIYSNKFISLLESYSVTSGKLNITIWVLEVPVLALLAFFVFMVSKEILRIEQNEISVIKSRGASRIQIILIYFSQSGVIAAISMLIGLPFAMMLCSLLGSTSGFLNFVNRSALISSINGSAVLFGLLAALASALTMTIPVIGFSRVTIVNYKNQKQNRSKKPFWQRFYLDIAALALSLYALNSFYSGQDAMSKAISDVQSIDPVILLSSSLFIIGAGLLVLRLFPYFVKLVFLIGKKRWSPPWYASFMKVIRSAGDEQFIMIFLIFTMAVAIFSAKTARTINLNSEDQISYTIGADLVLKDVWESRALKGIGETEPDATDVSMFIEPDIGRYNLPGVNSIARVVKEDIKLRKGSAKLTDAYTTLMAISPKEFGETAWSRDDLLATHINNYLNVLASVPEAILVSVSYKDNHNIKLGDKLTYETRYGTTTGVVYGFIDYWPGFTNTTRLLDATGTYTEIANHLVIANLEYFQTIFGVAEYWLWIDTNTESSQAIRDLIIEKNYKVSTFLDANAEIINSRNSPVLQGTNGVLTVSFFIALAVTFVGFLIYWILSIRSRSLQFGIFRAMGMSVGSLNALLINEQVLITGLSLLLGVGVGELASTLFVPVLQVSYTAAEKAIPFKIVIESGDYIRLLVVFGAMILLCMIILLVMIKKIKITQTLKLGED